MKKLFFVGTLGLSLMLIEFTLLLILNQIGYVLDSNTNFPLFKIHTAAKYSMEVNLMRLIFYFPVWIILMITMLERLNNKNIVLKIALLNVFLYLLLSGVYSLIFPFATEYFQRLFFYFLTISTFLSPFILNVLFPKLISKAFVSQINKQDD